MVEEHGTVGGLARRLLTLLLVLAVPLFLIATNVRLMINEPRLYTVEFERQRIAEATGLTPGQLEEAARQIRSYFNSREEFLDLRVETNGVESSLYNPREVLHMRDVKGLVQGVYRVQLGAGAFAGLAIAVAVLRWRGRGWRWVVRWVWGGALLTLGLVLGTALVALLAWRPLFLLFHKLSFANDLWQLDPRYDYLLMMFPSPFFLEATLLIAVATVGEALLLGALAWAVRRRWMVADKPTPLS